MSLWILAHINTGVEQADSNLQHLINFGLILGMESHVEGWASCLFAPKGRYERGLGGSWGGEGKKGYTVSGVPRINRLTAVLLCTPILRNGSGQPL
jgi:hypothetical protein